MAKKSNTKSNLKVSRLRDIAYARSGDKGSDSNIGVMAYTYEGYEEICRQLSIERVKQHFASLGVTSVTRYELPNLWALNFILHNALDGGGSLSLRLDSQGKALGEVLLQMEIEE